MLDQCIRSVQIPFAALLLAATISGCADNSQQGSQTPPTLTADDKAVSADAVDSPAPADADRQSGSAQARAFDGLRFDIPSEWKEVPLSAMQKGIITARFTMPDISDDLTLTLSRSGGSVDDNMRRWQGQFGGAEADRLEATTVAGVESRLIDIQGTFAAGFGRPPAEGWRMIGVIVPLPDQGYFIKLTGPVDSVAQMETAFDTFLQSARID